MATAQHNIELAIKIRLDDAAQRIASLERELARMNQSIESAAKRSVDSIAQSIESVRSRFGDVVKGIAGFRFLDLGIGAITDAVIGLDKATAQIRTLGGTARQIAPELESLAIKMSSDIPISATELQQATYDALSAGIEANRASVEAFMRSAAQLAVGGGEQIKNTVNILSSLVNAYGTSADKAQVFADQLFQTVNLGKTTIPELSSALAQIIPTAASVKLSFENVGGALAVMTAAGIPTQQAATKLNQLLVQMIRPSEDLAAVMQKAGVSIESLSREGLAETIRKMSAAMQELGLQAGAVFTSVEASAAFSTLAADVGKFASAVDSVRDATGTSQAAMQDMMQTTDAAIKQLQRSIEQIVYTVGGIAVDTMTPIVTMVADVVNAIAKHKDIVMALVASYGAYKAINSDILASLSKWPQQLIAMTSAMTAKTVATNAATMATNALRAAWMTNPLGLIIAGVMGAVAAFNTLLPLIHQTTDSKLKDAEATQELINKQIEETKQTIRQKESKHALLQEYIALAEKSTRTAQEHSRLNELQSQITKAYPSLIQSTSSYTDTLALLKEESSRTSDELQRLQARLTNLNKQAQENQKRILELQVQVAAEKLTESFDGLSGILKRAFSRIIITPQGPFNVYALYTDLLRRAAKEVQESSTETIDRAAEQLRSVAAINADDLAYFIRRTYKTTIEESRNIANELKSSISASDLLNVVNAAEQMIAAQQRRLQLQLAITTQSAAEVTSAQDQVSAYERINRAIAELMRSRPESKELLHEKVKTIESQIQAARNAQQLDEQQADKLYKRLEQLKESSRERAKSDDDALKKQIELIKAMRDEQLQQEKLRQLEAERERLQDGRTKSAAEEVAEAERLAKIHAQAAEAAAKIVIPDSRSDAASLKREITDIIASSMQAEVELTRLRLEQDRQQQERIRALREAAIEEITAKLSVTTDPRQIIELRSNLVRLMEEKISDLTLRIQASLDPIDRAKLGAELSQIQKQLDDTRAQLEIDIVANSNVEEIAELNYRIALKQAQRLRDAEIAAAGDSIAKRLAAEQQYREKVLQIQQRYLQESMKLTNIYTDALQKASSSFLAAMIENQDYFQHAISRIDKRAMHDQRKSADERNATMNDYIQGRISATKALQAIAEAESQQFQRLTEFQRRALGGVVKATESMYKTLDQRAQLIARELLPATVSSIDDLLRVNLDAVRNYTEVSVGMASASFGAMLAAGLSFGEAFRRGFLDALIRQAEAAIATYIPQIYAAFSALLGPFGIPAATSAIALITALLEAARSKIAGYAHGVIGIDGPGTSTSDSIFVRVSRGESIITSAGTKRNRHILQLINAGYPIEQQLIRLLAVHHTPTHYANDDMIAEIRALRKTITTMMRSRRDYIHHQLDIHVNDRAIIDRIERHRVNQLRAL